MADNEHLPATSKTVTAQWVGRSEGHVALVGRFNGVVSENEDWVDAAAALGPLLDNALNNPRAFTHPQFCFGSGVIVEDGKEKHGAFAIMFSLRRDHPKAKVMLRVIRRQFCGSKPEARKVMISWQEADKVGLHPDLVDEALRTVPPPPSDFHDVADRINASDVAATLRAQVEHKDCYPRSFEAVAAQKSRSDVDRAFVIDATKHGANFPDRFTDAAHRAEKSNARDSFTDRALSRKEDPHLTLRDLADMELRLNWLRKGYCYMHRGELMAAVNAACQARYPTCDGQAFNTPKAAYRAAVRLGLQSKRIGNRRTA